MGSNPIISVMGSNLYKKIITFFKLVYCRAIKKRTRDLIVYNIKDITVFDVIIFLALIYFVYLCYNIG